MKKSGGEAWLKVIWFSLFEHISRSGNEVHTKLKEEETQSKQLFLEALIEHNCAVPFACNAVYLLCL